ncbi:hypothetical protein QZH41_015630, partial [Actinostola sp. cb2023]
MAARGVLHEAAFHAFEVEFTRNGFQIPEGLVRLLREFTLKPDETPKEGRARLYKRLFCLLWHGSGRTLGKTENGQWPTYVYPATLKHIVRVTISGELVDQADPTHATVSYISSLGGYIQ